MAKESVDKATHLDHVEVGHIISSRPHERHTAAIDLRPAIVKLTEISQPIKVRLIGNSNLTNLHYLSFNFGNDPPCPHLLESLTNQGILVETGRIDRYEGSKVTAL